MLNIQTDIVANTKSTLLATIDKGIESMLEKFSADILNLELSILHQYKLYNEQAQNIQGIFDRLDDNIDYVFSEHRKTLCYSIENLFNELRDNKQLLDLTSNRLAEAK